MDSALGKLILLPDEPGGEAKVIAKGVRNPQNFALDEGNLFFPEQGPRGGDELNVFSLSWISNGEGKIPNYGWPLASVGEHYGDEIKPLAPLVDNHGDIDGLEEPLHEWQRSLGLSSVALSPWSAEGLVLGTMGSRSDLGDKSLLIMHPSTNRGGKYELTDVIELGYRVRDIQVINGTLLIFTDEGKFITLRPNN